MEDSEPFRLTPANREVEKLLCRLCRLLSLLEAFDEAAQDGWPRPILARDFEGLYWLLIGLINAVECQVARPRRYKTWIEGEVNSKEPPPRVGLLIHLLRVCRRSATQLLRVHDRIAIDEWEERQQAPPGGCWPDDDEEEEVKPERCGCHLCHDVWQIKWLLGKSRRLLGPVVSRSRRERAGS